MKLEVGRCRGTLTVYHFFDFAKEDSVEAVWTAFNLGQEYKENRRMHFSGWNPGNDEVKTKIVETDRKCGYEIATEIIRKGRDK